MKSKTSYFNKAVFKKDMTQFWSLWAVEIFFAFIVFVMPLISSVNGVIGQNMGYDQPEVDAVESIQGYAKILANPFFIFAIAIVVAVVVFQYTFSSREMYMIHSLPVNRECLFISHYIAGVVMILIPYVTGFACFTIVAQIYHTGLILSLFLMAFEVLAMILLFYGIACLVVMVSGNSIMAISIYCVLNVLYIGLYVMFMSVNQMFSYAGRDVSIADVISSRYAWLSPVTYLYRKVGFRYISINRWSDSTSTLAKSITLHDIVPFIVALAAAIFIFFAALLLYKYRRSETVGDVIAFGWGKPVYRTIFSIAGGMFLALLLWILYFQKDMSYMMSESGSYEKGRLFEIAALILICVVICYFVSEMLIKKTFFIWKTFSKINFIVVAGGIFVFLVLEATGVIGIKIPELNNVSSLEVTSSNELLYTDKHDISNFIKLNKEIEERKPSVKGGEGRTVAFIYRLKNGLKREFSYELPSGQGTMADKIVQCANSSKQKYEAVFSRAYKEPDFKLQQMDVQMSGADGITVYDSYTVSTEEARKKVYDAVLKDLDAGNIDTLDLEYAGDYDDEHLSFKTYVNINMAEKYKMSDYERRFFYVNNASRYVESKSLRITYKAKNTKKMIEDLLNKGQIKKADYQEE